MKERSRQKNELSDFYRIYFLYECESVCLPSYITPCHGIVGTKTAACNHIRKQFWSVITCIYAKKIWSFFLHSCLHSCLHWKQSIPSIWPLSARAHNKKNGFSTLKAKLKNIRDAKTPLLLVLLVSWESWVHFFLLGMIDHWFASLSGLISIIISQISRYNFHLRVNWLFD